MRDINNLEVLPVDLVLLGFSATALSAYGYNRLMNMNSRSAEEIVTLRPIEMPSSFHSGGIGKETIEFGSKGLAIGKRLRCHLDKNLFSIVSFDQKLGGPPICSYTTSFFHVMTEWRHQGYCVHELTPAHGQTHVIPLTQARRWRYLIAASQNSQ
jgi:hypothetical protein